MEENLKPIQRRVGVNDDGIWGPATAAAILAALGPVPAHRLQSPAVFFGAIRALTGALDQVQVDVVNQLLAKGAHWPAGWLAYGLATAWHEAWMRPVEEIGKGRGRAYGKPGRHAGQIAYGRGLVQLTWDYNYATADEKLGLHGALTKNYALALQPGVAADILVHGMEGGWFTGKGLRDYLPAPIGTLQQFGQARRIINGMDQADKIAGHAKLFQDALVAGGWG